MKNILIIVGITVDMLWVSGAVMNSAIAGCYTFRGRENHQWMLSRDGELSSMDGEMSSMDGSVIRGCHPSMPSMDEDDG
jgi:hypothetical protein